MPLDAATIIRLVALFAQLGPSLFTVARDLISHGPTDTVTQAQLDGLAAALDVLDKNRMQSWAEADVALMLQGAPA